MATIKAFKNEILRIAEANLGEKAWSYFQSRQAKRNPNVKFGTFELKNNLFVYEILLASLIDIGTPNIISDERLKIKLEGKTERPPTAQQWNEGEVPNFEEVDREKAEGGDVCTDDSYCGIVDCHNQTISAAKDKVVSNDWGWRNGQNNAKFFSLNKIP